ncbi:fimbrial protein [Pseudomonas sp. v388]|uniref:fimbrial protein n=1 Tax=Pseudomonas sp. v388 TaxID=2479849 RepID=UPI0013154D7D|nr:fimbrial protein [Pseudomonas sp. v388]
MQMKTYCAAIGQLALRGTSPRTLQRVLSVLALMTLCHAPQVLANPRVGSCLWPGTPGELILRRDIGTLYVARDAVVGTVIGHTPGEVLTWPDDRRQLHCYIGRNDAGTVLRYSARASVPIFSGSLPPINGEDVTGKILQTNIPGVGVHIRLGWPYNGMTPNSFTPLTQPVVPFDGEATRIMLVPIPAGEHRSTVTLVKTGPIPVGPQTLDGSELFSGTYSDVGKGASFGLTGTVVQAQCTVSGNPVSADPVQLGEWETTDFTGQGDTTTAIPFSIRLSACEADGSGDTIATAHMKLEGKQGSTPIDAAKGVFSLTTASTAKGVGIQILKADGITPMELGTEVPVVTLSNGDAILNFNARFYQTGSSVTAGDAKGALDFTMTYK